MNDYIMNRESLKRHCEAMCKKFKDVPTSGAYGEHRLVLDLLEQTEWIPVSERLPEKTGWYLITFKTYNGDDAVSEMCYRKPENYWTDKNICKKLFDNNEVIAWMPKPKAYKAGSEDI